MAANDAKQWRQTMPSLCVGISAIHPGVCAYVYVCVRASIVGVGCITVEHIWTVLEQRMNAYASARASAVTDGVSTSS
eukprot:2630731-Alexandrium_andersonii.AAC.1